jgi:glucose/arabinose dehydrogenase
MRRIRYPKSVLFLAAISAACDPATGTSVGEGSAAAGCSPLETRAPNARDQKPEFPEQTRACASPSGVAFDVVVVARGLVHPWAVEPLPNGDLLVTERPARMRVVSDSGRLGEPIAGLPPVDARGQGGLLDVALAPDFASSRTLFWSYSEPRQGGNATSVARGVLSADGRRLEDVRVVFRALPTYDGDKHFGSRVVFGPDGMLYVTLGERSDRDMRPQAQRLDSHMGKTIRVKPDGSVPEDNPFVGTKGALPEIWSLGHRNVQSAAFDARGRLWEVEHGTRGGDELNLVAAGKNYGWPEQAFGEEYVGSAIRGAATSRPGMESPVYYWDPVIAPSGMEIYSGDAFPAWRGSVFVGALKETRLVRLELRNDRVVGEEHLLADRGQRIRDVRQGPDGALYLVTDEAAGELWRLAPAKQSTGRNP